MFRANKERVCANISEHNFKLTAFTKVTINRGCVYFNKLGIMA